jgi:hypothetical protein
MSDLPNNLSVGALWQQLNDPRRWPTPQSTVEAIMWTVRERGVAALKEPANVERLARCDEAARTQINERVAKLQKGSPL